jgi:hypothetical protein
MESSIVREFGRRDSMKLNHTLGMLALVGAFAMGASPAARADEKHVNLKVIKDAGKDLDKGMKALSKGLGVKCVACHEQGKFDSDKVKAKEAGRTFFSAAVGEKDTAKRDAALAELLKALELKEAKDAAKVWEGVGMFAKQ